MNLNMHPEAIISKAKKLIKPLSELEKYHLAGGTGLALQIGHRKSVDFDFFTPNGIKGTIGNLENILPSAKVQVKVSQTDQLTVAVNSVQISFIKYPFSIFSSYKKWKGLKLIPAHTIAAMKAYTLGRRATFKDYVDLYYVIKLNICDLSEIIKLSNKIFSSAFNDRLFLEQLVYLEDVEEQKIVFIENEVTKQDLKEFFEAKVKNLVF